MAADFTTSSTLRGLAWDAACSGTPGWAKGKSAQKSPFLLCTMLDAAVLFRLRGKTGRFQES